MEERAVQMFALHIIFFAIGQSSQHFISVINPEVAIERIDVLISYISNQNCLQKDPELLHRCLTII